jgi:hypothetical protein
MASANDNDDMPVSEKATAYENDDLPGQMMIYFSQNGYLPRGISLRIGISLEHSIRCLQDINIDENICID